MSTSAPVLEQTDSQIQSENNTYKVWVKVGADQKVIEKETIYRAVNADPTKEDRASEELSNAGYQIGKIQTIKGYAVKSLAALEELIGDSEEAGNIGNRGLQQKYNQKVKEHLTAFDSASQTWVNEQTDEVYDSRELLQEPTQRRNLTAQDKLARDFKKSGLTDDVIAAMMAAMQAAMNK